MWCGDGRKEWCSVVVTEEIVCVEVMEEEVVMCSCFKHFKYEIP